MQTIECVPAQHRDFVRDFFTQQLWCWGQDVREQENLLIQRGFERHRPPEGVKGRTHYRLDESGMSVSLWGFGAFFGVPGLGGVFLHRLRFRPKLFRESEIPPETWTEWDLPRCLEQVTTVEDRDRLRKLMVMATEWMADYERWIAEVRGHDYRRRCVGTWKRPVLTAEVIAPVWSELAADLRGADLVRPA